MASRFEKFVMSAALTAGIAGGTGLPEKAHAAEPELGESTEQLSDTIDDLLEKKYSGYDFKVSAYTADSMFKKGPGEERIQYQYRHGAGDWTTGEVRVSRTLPIKDIQTAVIEQIGQRITEQQQYREQIHQIVENFDFKPAAASFIESIGGDPHVILTQDAHGHSVLQIRVSNTGKDNAITLGESTASALLTVTNNAQGERLLELQTIGEDGTKQSLHWDEDGKYLGNQSR